MKKKLSVLLSFCLALFVLQLPFISSIQCASALSISSNHYYNISDSLARVWIDALKNNTSWPSQISREDFYCCIMFDNSQSTPVLKRIVIIDKAHSMSSSNSLYSFIAPTSYYIQYSSFSISTPSGLQSLNLQNFAQSGPGRDIGVVAYDGNYFMTYVNASYAPEEQTISFPYASITIPSFDIIYVPDGYDLYTGIHFSYDVDDFYTWIINNNKLSVLPSYIAQDKLKSEKAF